MTVHEEIHAAGWERLLEAFAPRPQKEWRKTIKTFDFSHGDEEPSREYFLDLWEGLEEHYDMDIVLVDPKQLKQHRKHAPKKMVPAGVCLGTHEIVLGVPSFAVLTHEAAHALDQRFPDYEWGLKTESIAISVEHLICHDIIDYWEPDVPYGYAWKVTSETILENRERIEDIYSAIASSLAHTQMHKVIDGKVKDWV